MKKILFLLAFLITLHLHAQDVWKEGTQWVVTYENDSVATFVLDGHCTINGVDYLKLNYMASFLTPIGYIRTERCDTMVYARAYSYMTGITEEFVLYDFGTFEPGTTLQYSETDSTTHAITLRSVIINADSVNYYHDVIEDGDILPCYKDIIFKVGHLGGPLYLIDRSMNLPFWRDDKPKRKNISHTVLKLNDDRTVELLPSGIATIKADAYKGQCYNLQGIRVNYLQKGVYNLNGKKYIK